jgi:hypothetical protein
MSPSDALEERRKKTTLRKVNRKHAGKIVQPYAIMERLIAEVEQLEPLKKAKIIIVWKSGWMPTKDEILKHAQIRKLSELEREIWGDEYDLCMLLHRELWQSNRFTEEEREMDIFHELLHPVPEVDDKTGEQKKDDRDRLVWRLRNHPIQRFPEEIDRYGIDKVLQLDETAREAVDEEDSRADAIAEENDAARPLLKEAEKGEAKVEKTEPPTGEWRKTRIDKSGLFTEKQADALEAAGLRTLGGLQEAMVNEPEWWAKNLKVNGRYKAPIEEALTAFIGRQSEQS